MTSTISDHSKLFVISLVAVAAVFIIVVAFVNQSQQSPAARNRVPTLPASVVAASEPAPIPEPAKDEEKPPTPESPYYGSTVYEGEVTSVYFYPQGSKSAPGAAQTHIKFNHHEESPEEIWLCGDERHEFEVAHRYTLVVTFEPNTECISNWKIR